MCSLREAEGRAPHRAAENVGGGSCSESDVPGMKPSFQRESDSGLRSTVEGAQDQPLDHQQKSLQQSPEGRE
jgi:hypothetical protein